MTRFDLQAGLGQLRPMQVRLSKMDFAAYQAASLRGVLALGLMLASVSTTAGQVNLPGAVPAPFQPGGSAAKKPVQPPVPAIQEGHGSVRLFAQFGETEKPVGEGAIWRIFRERAETDGTYKLLRRSTLTTPLLTLPHGNYVVHLSFGLAGVSKRVEIKEKIQRVEFVLRAGMLEITGMLDGAKVDAERLRASVYIPDKRNPEAKLIARNIRPGQGLGLPEGNYHIVTTYLEAGKAGRDANARRTNSVVNTDVRIRSGQLTEAILKHKAAQLTLKLVKTPGSEALANTSFTVLTPGGDVLREMIGAFPSIVLAEGEYVAIARNEGRTFQSTFKVVSGTNRDVEILAK